METIEYKPLFDEEAIALRIKALGAEITKDYNGEELIVIGVLKGSFVFVADLIRKINLPLQVEFIGVSSYEGTVSTGEVRITSDLYSEIKGRHVLLVEDIVDTGRTIDFLLNTLDVRGPKSLKICTLLSKPESHVMTNPIDYIGFEISSEFVIGYGLDLDGKHREIPYIAQVKT